MNSVLWSWTNGHATHQETFPKSTCINMCAPLNEFRGRSYCELGPSLTSSIGDLRWAGEQLVSAFRLWSIAQRTESRDMSFTVLRLLAKKRRRTVRALTSTAILTQINWHLKQREQNKKHIYYIFCYALLSQGFLILYVY